MNLEFKVCSVKKMSPYLEKLIDTNEFIIVGEIIQGNEELFMIHEIGASGLKLINGLNIQEFSYRYPKDNVVIDDTHSVSLDIPKKFLTMEIIEDIQRLNI